MQEVPGPEPAEVIDQPATPAAQRPGCRPSRFLGLFGLVALCLVVYLPGFFSIPPVDRDESRFAQASRQMFESIALPAAYRDPARHGGGVLVPMVQDRPRLNKPPLIYWAQASAAAVLTGGNPWRDAIWMYRVPSLLAAIGAVLLTWRMGASLFDPRTGRLAAALLACCPMLVWEARQARADMLLLLCTLAAQRALWHIFAAAAPAESQFRDRYGGGAAAPESEGGAWKWPLVFWAAQAAGIMTKGPITPLVSGLTILALCVVSRRWGWTWRLRPAVGLLIVAAAVGPWVWAVAHRVGWQTYLSTIKAEVLGRSVSAREGHWGPPGYHTILLPILFWPGSLLTAAGIGLAVQQGIRRGPGRAILAGYSPYLFCLAWIVPAWLVFELVGTKLPHYTMPMYPAIAILSARAIFAADEGILRLSGRAGRIGLGLWLAIGAGIACALPLVLGYGGAMTTRLSIAAAIAAGLCVLIGAYLLVKASQELRRGRFIRAALAGIIATLWVSVLAIGVVLPRGRSLWMSRSMAEAIAAHDAGGSRPLASAGYAEDSLIFLTRGRIDRIGAQDAKPWAAAHPDGLIWVPPGVLSAGDFVGPGEHPAEQLAEVSGFNYSRGKRERFLLYGRP